MADSIVQPSTNDADGQEDSSEPRKEDIARDQKVELPHLAPVLTPAMSTPRMVIWTPRFIVLFTLTLVAGLTMNSMLAQGWANHFIVAAWVSLGHVAVATGCLLSIIVVTRSRWFRLGGIFGCAWAIFTSINLLLTLITLDPTSPILAYVNVAISSALLGTYTCFSLEQTPLTRWDGWFFSIALLVSLCVLCLSYVLMPVDSRSLAAVGSGIAATCLILSMLVWWLRPSCWKTQPGATFLLGVMPALFLLLALPNVGRGQTNFYLTQVAFLAFLLGVMRVLQGEMRKKRLAKSTTL
ncbi:MAG: hypothetical protein ABI396_19155 [Ktedonobacteraceae bacterium]